MVINFDPGVYARLSPEVRLYALGLIPTKPPLKGANWGPRFESFEELGGAIVAPPAGPARARDARSSTAAGGATTFRHACYANEVRS
jgi:hypothetical protein